MMKKSLYWMVLTFVITTTIAVVINASVQFRQNSSSSSYVLADPQSKENTTITLIFNQFGNEGMGKSLVDSAADKLRSNHPDLDINIKYIETGLDNNNTRYQMLNALTNGTSVDIITLDQIWLGEFAQKGLLTDLTNYTRKWGRQNDWYQQSWDGGVYNDSVYGIWAWTDVRGMWYWKDILNKSNVIPDSLKTWDGYLAAAKKINNTIQAAEKEGNNTLIQPMHLNGDVGTAVDMWYP